MDQVVANGSLIDTMIITIGTRLIDNPTKTKYSDLSDPVKANPLAMVQWSQQTILGNNLDFWLTGENTKPLVSYVDIKSMKDLGMNFNVPPEFT